MKILYLFPTPRGDVIKKANYHEAPDTILYGFNHLKRMGFNVDYLDLPLTKSNLYFLILFPIEQILVWLKGINFQIYRVLPKLNEINSYDLVVTCSEPLGLPLAFLKKLGLFKRKHLYMSLDFVSRFKNDQGVFPNFFRWILSTPEAIVCFSDIEKEYFKKIFKINDQKLFFIPAGGDPTFYKLKKGKGEFILTVGKDRSRDFQTFFEASKDLGERVVAVVGSRSQLPPKRGNVRILKDLHFLKLRDLYRKAKLLVLPLHEQHRASGQIVLLDSVLSGIPVIASGVLGITTAYEFKDSKTLFIVSPSDPHKLREKIKFVLSHPEITKKVSENAFKEVMAKYTTKHFAHQLSKIINSL